MYYVYKYIDKDENVLYVGQTIDLDRRFSEHKGKIWDKQKEKILFAKCSTEVDMCIYEMYYINKLKAKYNTALVYNESPSFELPELTWKEYNKNHFEETKKKTEDKIRKRIQNKFSPEIFYRERIEKLKEKFNKTEIFQEKKEILIEIRKCEEKMKK